MKDGDNVIKEFVNGGFKYVLASPAVVISKVKLNGVDISKYLSNETTIGWYDVSKNSGRDATNADGTMVLNVIATKYRIDLATRPLTQYEFIDFFAEIIKSPKISVDFLNPFTGKWQNMQCYRGDRTAQAMLPYKTDDGLIELYSPVKQAIIEL